MTPSGIEPAFNTVPQPTAPLRTPKNEKESVTVCICFFVFLGQHEHTNILIRTGKVYKKCNSKHRLWCCCFSIFLWNEI